MRRGGRGDSRQRVDGADRDRTCTQLTDCPRGGLDHRDIGVVDQDEHGRDGEATPEGGRELGCSSADGHGTVGGRPQPRVDGVVGRGACQCSEGRGADAGVVVGVDGALQSFDVGEREGVTVAEGRELGRTCDRARVGHGNRPLMAMTRPAKIVATTAATRNPVNPTRNTSRTSAMPRLAVRMPKLDAGRAPSDTGGVAG